MQKREQTKRKKPRVPRWLGVKRPHREAVVIDLQPHLERREMQTQKPEPEPAA